MPNPPITPAQTDALAKLAEIPAVGSEELERLSRAATQGKWGVVDRAITTLPAHIGTGIARECGMHDNWANDCAFIVALVNAYRSGKLISTPLVDDTGGGGEKGGTGEPFETGSSPLGPTPSGSAGNAATIPLAAQRPDMSLVAEYIPHGFQCRSCGGSAYNWVKKCAGYVETGKGCCPDFRQWIEKAKAGEPTVEERHKAKLRKDPPFIGLPLGNGEWI